MKNAKRTLSLIVFIGVAVLIAGGIMPGKTADEPPAGDKGIVTEMLNDFEDCSNWRAEATCPIGDTAAIKYDFNTQLDAKKKPNASKEDEVSDAAADPANNKSCLGVKTYFMDRGFDRVEVFPPTEYIIRGKAREISIWVLGRNFRHTLYVKLRDYKGSFHKLRIGRLDFWGWKKLSVVVPGWLPQSSTYALLDKNLHFVSLYIECDLHEVPGTFYTYFDNLIVKADMSDMPDDADIKDNW